MGKQTDATLAEHVSGQSNKPLTSPAHALEWKVVAHELRADIDDGLTSSDASERLNEAGRNELGDANGVNPVKILIRQVANAVSKIKYERHGERVSHVFCSCSDV